MTQFDAWPLGGGVWVGPVRRPRNSAAHQKGSIHDDVTAQKLGFRGGTVAGSLHMEQFPPLLLHMFGPRWWHSGSLSLYFRYATTDLEPVQCHAVAPMRPPTEDVRIEVWMDHPQSATHRSERVADGTASVGKPDCGSALRQRIQLVPEPGELRILSSLMPNTHCDGVPTRIPHDALIERLDVITEPLDEYTANSCWGRPALPPSLMVRAMRAVEPGLLARTGPVVGLFGAIEVQHLDGPLFVETDYLARGRVLAVSETPKTEFFWYESTLTDPAEGKDVASMLMMLRFMKASSPLWVSTHDESAMVDTARDGA
jgi:hypothetical protein